LLAIFIIEGFWPFSAATAARQIRARSGPLIAAGSVPTSSWATVEAVELLSVLGFISTLSDFAAPFCSGFGSGGSSEQPTRVAAQTVVITSSRFVNMAVIALRSQAGDSARATILVSTFSMFLIEGNLHG
jgi:hypothetical protein